MQIAENAHQIAAHGATNAAAVHFKHFFIGVDHQILVDANLAEFIFDHSDAHAVLFGQYAVQQGGFAAAQKASQYGNGNLLRHGYSLLFWVDGDSSATVSALRLCSIMRR